MKIGIHSANPCKTSPAWFYAGACCYTCPKNVAYRWKRETAKNAKRHTLRTHRTGR